MFNRETTRTQRDDEDTERYFKSTTNQRRRLREGRRGQRGGTRDRTRRDKTGARDAEDSRGAERTRKTVFDFALLCRFLRFNSTAFVQLNFGKFCSPASPRRETSADSLKTSNRRRGRCVSDVLVQTGENVNASALANCTPESVKEISSSKLSHVRNEATFADGACRNRNHESLHVLVTSPNLLLIGRADRFAGLGARCRALCWC